MTVSRHPSVLLDKVFTLIGEKADKANAPLVEKFARILFKNISAADLYGRSDSDLYGASLSLWQRFSHYNSAQPFINVFNPQITKHGWQSEHTIVELIIQDMPFLVDSVRIALNRLGITAHLLLHSPIAIVRDKSHHLINVNAEQTTTVSTATKETVFLIEIDHQDTPEQIARLKDELRSVLSEVLLVVNDWEAMLQKLLEAKETVVNSPFLFAKTTQESTIQFIDWLADHHFTLMGYRYYEVNAEDGDHLWHPLNETSLGIMKNSIRDRDRRISNLPSSARKETLSQKPLLLTKTSSLARVHRPAYIDYIGVKAFNAKGEVIGEHRFLGLYSATLYNSSVMHIPILSQKIRDICEAADVETGTHAQKAIVNILETYPRDELLHSPINELAKIVSGIFQMQERGISRMFTRKDVFGRFISCMTYVPREKYNTALRKQTQGYLKFAFASEQEVEFTTYFSESVYARTHYIVRVADNNMDYPVKEIEQNIIELTKTWPDRLSNVIKTAYGEGKSVSVIERYAANFSQSYMDQYLPSAALGDIEKLECLSDDNPLEMLFYRPQEIQNTSKAVRLKLYHQSEPIHLSDVLPMLENFGLRVIDETPYKIATKEGGSNWIMDFSMLHESFPTSDMSQSQSLFQDGFAQVWQNHLEDDAFNRLILSGNLTGRNVTILRAYAKYMRQIGLSFSVEYIANTMAAYPKISAALIELFAYRFEPKNKFKKQTEGDLVDAIMHSLDGVSNLDDDRIIRKYLDMILATVRTNFYQPKQNGEQKSYVSFKLLPELINDMPLPIPKFEIFVYSPQIEGVHLRGGKVARGGLRWSDRFEDFRTEVLGLVKAQQVKNTVIVPVGAKGGFVCKQLPKTGGRDAFIAAGQACYRTFIRSLLDITDNIVDGAVVYPNAVVRHDDDDPYLVVAADKGTATFSDIANEISDEFNFWLGDAFASGGSVGYDHKKMGITARGAWESVKRHFRELGVDCQTTEFSCVAVGDMAGDVFGNGMLLSQKTRLIAAFNHMHIFFDPNPNVAESFAERERLFADPSLNWADYNTKLISKGGGVFSRRTKSIPLSAEMKKWLNTKKLSITPNEFIHQILQMPVDLLWNGGIGTYVKSSKENDSDVGDRANDAVRVNGKQLQAKIIGEGGNLGCTQLGRVEFAKLGGKINTDFIDNVGGVDCSDNEVNIKILLNALVNNGDLTVKQRNAMLYEMTDDVADIVLDDCYRQTQSISITDQANVAQIKEQLRFIHTLERDGHLNRELEYIPTDEEFSERIADGVGLTRPELSVLISYAKMVLKEELNQAAITDNAYYQKFLVGSFPQLLQDKYQAQMQQHPLRGEIIATKLTNYMINDMGINFAHRLNEETGASICDIAIAYSTVKALYDLGDLWRDVEQLDNKIDSSLQLQILDSMRRSVRRATRWMLREHTQFESINSAIEFYRPVYSDLLNNISEYLVAEEVTTLNNTVASYVEQGVPEAIAYRIGIQSNTFSALDLAHIVEKTQLKPALVERLYFQLGSHLQLHWFLEQINQQGVNNHWQALARASYREELDHQQRLLTISILKRSEKLASIAQVDDLLVNWMDENSNLINRWSSMMSEFKTSQSHEFAKFSVALRELLLLTNKVSAS